MFIRKSALLMTIMITAVITNCSLAQEKILSGAWYVNQTIPSFSLDKNTGERSATLEINFDKRFNVKPNIFLSLSQLDASKESNLRYRIEAVSVTREGFVLKISTWADSKLFSLSGYWLAFSD